MKFSKLILTSLLIATVIFASGCSNKKAAMDKRLDFLSAQTKADREHAVSLIDLIKDSNKVLSIQGFEDEPITINAKSIEIRTPMDVEEIFNSEAFRRDYGAMFPKTTNGWDAFIAFLSTAEKVSGNPVPWLAGAINRARSEGITINGNENAVAGTGLTRSQVADSNNETDNSDNSNNSDNSSPFEDVLVSPEL